MKKLWLGTLASIYLFSFALFFNVDEVHPDLKDIPVDTHLSQDASEQEIIISSKS